MRDRERSGNGQPKWAAVRRGERSVINLHVGSTREWAGGPLLPKRALSLSTLSGSRNRQGLGDMDVTGMHGKARSG